MTILVRSAIMDAHPCQPIKHDDQMTSVILNLILSAILIGAGASGVALFWIARQDDSRAGRLIGITLMSVSVFIAGGLTLAQGWF